MKNNRFKIFTFVISYSVLIFLIIISVNAIVPEEKIPVLEQNEKLIKKVENKFSRNQNSVYEILEENKQSKSTTLKLPKDLNKQPDDSIINNKHDDFFRLQLASFKDEKKSLKVSKKLNKTIRNNSLKINLVTTRVNVNENQTFFRVITENQFSFPEARSKCKKLKEIQIKCIVIKG